MKEKKHSNTLSTLILILSLVFSSLSFAQSDQKDRVIILTDIEADLDDTQSLVRLFLYSNEIDIQGIVATTSCWHQSQIDPESIRKVIRAYGKIQPNLLKHEKAFPDAKVLLNLVKDDVPKYGMLGVGDDQASEGSDWIIKTLEEDDNRPLWISVWGGVNTLAQAVELHPDYANTIFKKTFGQTISDYLVEQRVLFAKRKLSITQDSITSDRL